MAELFNRVAVATSTTGTGTVTLGSALSGAFCTFAQAGASDGDVVTYMITEGSDFEIGRGTYTASGTTLSRDTVLLSKISGSAGTTKMTLAGGAEVRIIAAAEDINNRWRVLEASAVAASHTGSTEDTTLATITVPGGAMGANGVLRVTTLWSFTSSSNSKQTRMIFGGAGFAIVSHTTQNWFQHVAIIRNRNSESSQVVGGNTTTVTYGSNTDGIGTFSRDTSADQDITLVARLNEASETMTLESYIVEVFYQA